MANTITCHLIFRFLFFRKCIKKIITAIVISKLSCFVGGAKAYKEVKANTETFTTRSSLRFNDSYYNTRST